MLVEAGIWIGASFLTLKLKDYILSDKEPGKVKDRINRAFIAGAPKNKNDNSFKCIKCHRCEKGFFALIAIPVGLSYEQLESFSNVLKTNCAAKYMELEKSGKFAKVRLITEPLEEVDYTPMITKPNELHLGYNYNGHIKVNMSMFPHFIESGGPGTGKTRLLYVILTTLINQFKKTHIRIYLGQISKKELSIFRKCTQVDYVAMNINELYTMLLNIDKQRKERETFLGRYVDDGIFNIEDFNEAYPQLRIPYLYVFIDEFAFLTPTKSDDKDTKNMKIACLNMFLDILRAGRSSGVFGVSCLQQPDKESLPGYIKRLFQTVLSFKQPTNNASIVAIGDGAATELDIREALLQTNGRQVIKTPKIEYKDIKKYIADSIEENHEYIKLDENLSYTTEISEETKSILNELKIFEE